MLRNGIRELGRRRQALVRNLLVARIRANADPLARQTLHCLLSHRQVRTYVASQTAVATTNSHGGNEEVVVRFRNHDRISQSSALRRRTVPIRNRPSSSLRHSQNKPSTRLWDADADAELTSHRVHDRAFHRRRHRSASDRERKGHSQGNPPQADRDHGAPIKEVQTGLGWTTISPKYAKSWRNLSPNILLKRIIEPHPDSHYWKHQVALARSTRLPIVLLQLLLRREEGSSTGHGSIFEALPSPKKWREIWAILCENGYGQRQIRSLVSTLEGATDEERCLRALNLDIPIPNFIFNFLVRSTSTISRVSTLSAMIDLWGKSCRILIEEARTEARKEATKEATPFRERKHVVRPHFRRHRNKIFAPPDFDLTMNLLAYQCACLEPRLMLNLADVAVEYIRGIATLLNPPEKVYQDQCLLFNNALRAFQPQPRLQAAQISSPNAFFWEAQRVLLAMSAEMERSLLVNRKGFQAIRSVLSGLPKNRTEIHSSLRHASSWPPYIQPADGMDEVAEPEDSWSRAVSAGFLMQEAGFSKEDRDDAVDILNGMAADGTPTIQQRTAIAKERSLSSWEASIRATRNAHEAWERFRNPPQAGLQPGVSHYAAMFEKLVLREADAHSRMLPGDKAINFPARQESNLTEFEQARLRPPSVAQLFERMLGEGIRPAGNCLHVLVANASSIETARRYIDHSPGHRQLKWNLYQENPDPGLLQHLDVGLLAAYIQALTVHGSKRSGNTMMRAIRMARLRFGTSKSLAAQTVWGTILKNLSQHHVAMKISLGLQLKLLLHAVEQMGGRDGITLRAFVQFSKGIRKILRREVEPLAEQLTQDEASASRDPLLRLYEKDSIAQEASPVSTDAPDTSMASTSTSTSTKDAAPVTQPPDVLFRSGAARMRELYNTLKAQEYESQQCFDKHRVAALDRMAWRKDLLRSDHAHEYLLALAYVGEFEEMAAVLGGLVREWSQPDVVEALAEGDEPPPHADFFEALCAFRLLAEPMVDEGVVEGLRGEIMTSGVGWVWPDGAAIQTYLDIQEDDSTATLARVLEWVRKRRDEQKTFEAADLGGTS